MGRKSKKTKIPKKVGGVKIPKQARKAGDKALKLAAEHPVISDIVAAGLLAAAAALTGDKKLRDTARELGEEVKGTPAAGKAKSAAKAAAKAMGEALRDEFLSARTGKGPSKP